MNHLLSTSANFTDSDDTADPPNSQHLASSSSTAKSTPSSKTEKSPATRIPSDDLDSLVASATASVNQRSKRKNDAAKAQKTTDDDVPSAVQQQQQQVTDGTYPPLRSPGKTRSFRKPTNAIGKMVQEEKEAQQRVQRHVSELEEKHEKDMIPLRAMDKTVSHLLTKMAETWSNVAEPRVTNSRKRVINSDSDDLDSPHNTKRGPSPSEGSKSSALKDSNDTSSTPAKRFFAFRGGHAAPSPPKPSPLSKRSVSGRSLAKKTESKSTHSPPKARKKNLSRSATKKSDSTQCDDEVSLEPLPPLLDSDFWNKECDPVCENGLSALTAVAVEDGVYYTLPMFSDVSTSTSCTFLLCKTINIAHILLCRKLLKSFESWE